MKTKKLTNNEIGELCLSLSMLLHAGTGIADGLSLMAEDEEPSAYRDLLVSLAEAMDDGISFPDAVRQSGVFPSYVCGLLDVGRSTGRTEEALTALADNYQARASMDRRLRSALLYPAILLLVMLVVTVVLLVYVLPIFDDVYAQLGTSLTGAAGGLLALGGLLEKGMPVLCVVLGLLVVLVGGFAVSDTLRTRLVAAWRKRFGDRGISRGMSQSRFALALYMGVSSGQTISESVHMASELLEDVPAMQERCRSCLSYMDAGLQTAEAIKKSGLLPSAEVRLLETGIKSGSGDKAARQVAQRMEEQADSLLESRLGQVEPTLVVVSSVLIGVILLAVMLPLLHIMSAIG